MELMKNIQDWNPGGLLCLFQRSKLNLCSSYIGLKYFPTFNLEVRFSRVILKCISLRTGRQNIHSSSLPALPFMSVPTTGISVDRDAHTYFSSLYSYK